MRKKKIKKKNYSENSLFFILMLIILFSALFIGFKLTGLAGDSDGELNCTENQTCDTECTPLWYCTRWSDCIKNIQTRTCEDLNSCRDEGSRPDEEKKCKSDNIGLIFLILIISLIIAISIIFYILIRIMKKRRLETHQIR